MKENLGGAFVNDLDILGDLNLDESTNNESLDDMSSLPDGGAGDELSVDEILDGVTSEGESPEGETTDESDPIEEEKKDAEEKDKELEGEDLDKWLDELLKDNVEIEEKVEEIESAARDLGSDEVLKLISELQTTIVEKNLTIEELKKENEVSNNRYLSRFGDEEELSIYRGEIEKLQENPRLMALVKFFGTDNEKVKPKLVKVLSDLLFDLTGEDVSELLDEQNKAGLSILNSPDSDVPPMEESTPAVEENMDFEDSTNNILGL